MREIKFRAWDAENKEMAPVVEMLFNQYGGIDTRTSRRMDINEDCLGKNSLMQFTGLKDKNGKMIFEGDIVTEVSNHGNDYYEVVFGKGGFFIKNEKNEVFDNLHWHINGLKVIGNIYENPKLLTNNI